MSLPPRPTWLPLSPSHWHLFALPQYPQTVLSWDSASAARVPFTPGEAVPPIAVTAAPAPRQGQVSPRTAAPWGQLSWGTDGQMDAMGGTAEGPTQPRCPHIPPSWCPPVGCRQGTDSLNLIKCLRKSNVESSEGDKGQRLQPAASPEQGDGWGRGVPAGVTPTRVALGHMAHRHEWHSDMWHRGTDGAWT